jgi:hypothetical protein
LSRAERTSDYPAASRTYCFHTEAMTKEQPDYLSYLLRLRRVSGQEVTWRASLEDPHTGELHNFASLEEAVDFLQAQMGVESEPATNPVGRKGHPA